MRPAGSPLRRQLLIAAAAALAVPATGAAPVAEAGFPRRPIHLVVAAPPGGPSDALARMLADEMGRLLGQPMIIDNKPGAGGLLAAEAVARAPADGHVLMLSWIGNTTAQTLAPRAGLDIRDDFVHITQLVTGTNVLVLPPGGAQSLAELLARARARPGHLSYASAGNASSGHLAMEMLKQRAGVSLVHVPYRGGAPALTDLLAGRVDLMFLNQDAVLPYLPQGRLLALAVSSRERLALLPAVPTVAECGFPGFEATTWAGLSAPRGTPAAVVRQLYRSARQALQGPMRERQAALGAQVIASSPAQFTDFVRHETAKWAGVIRAAGITAD